MVIIDTLLKFIKRGDYDLFGIGNELYDTIDNLPIASGEGYYNHYSAHIKNLKNLAILILTAAQNKLKKQLGTEQEIMMNLSDMIQNVYMAESTLLRVQKIEEHKQTEMLPYYKDILDVFIYEATKTIVNRAIDSISSFADDDYDKLISATWKLGHLQRVNIKDARRRIADKLIDENKYCF
jgi:hypothetical protein